MLPLECAIEAFHFRWEADLLLVVLGHVHLGGLPVLPDFVAQQAPVPSRFAGHVLSEHPVQRRQLVALVIEVHLVLVLGNLGEAVAHEVASGERTPLGLKVGVLVPLEMMVEPGLRARRKSALVARQSCHSLLREAAGDPVRLTRLIRNVGMSCLQEKKQFSTIIGNAHFMSLFFLPQHDLEEG